MNVCVSSPHLLHHAWEMNDAPPVPSEREQGEGLKHHMRVRQNEKRLSQCRVILNEVKTSC